ncbi:methyl-accepting chemotaxis protein [Halomonas sp. CnH100-B]|uniref:methyl-accepting chemotaxis protein n=1 Tax=Halomonas sp. CnH100-B TaxID=2954490 RepID=UPI002097459F|nr:methyl-accepting chemotaxis protein [Halomonas sp. CnH100-B]MCO7228483.1 methyl-accepting chemotaxis protein [Halomonas sp. CnH100-B]
MRNLSVKHTLAAVQGLMLIALLAIAATGIMSKLSVMESLRELDEVAAQQVASINRAEVNLMELRLRLARYTAYVESGDNASAQEALELARAALERADARFAEFTAIEVPPTAARAPLIATIDRYYPQMINDAFRSDLAAANYSGLVRHRERFNEEFSALTDAIRAFNTRAQALAAENIAHAEQSHTVTLIVSGVLIALALLLSLGVQLGINRIIVRPLQRAVELCEHIAKGDLTSQIESRGKNEIGRLYIAMHDMQGKLQTMVGTLSQSSTAVAASSRQIAGGSQDLASRTEQQAAALQQTAASMDEISSIVRQNADTAAQAERLTQDASRKAAHGKQESEQTSVLMRELEASSQKVNEIIQVIDSIAFQTNILALNASVEAARAGEHGRGFAVVASEVRSLATKTSNSSKEIRTMIEDIASRIAQGADQALKNGESMDDINQAIVRVNDMMQELALAAKEQESGISQISTAIAEMDSATQENVSLVEETSTASASLQDEASRLADLVAAFRLNGTSRHAALAQPASAPAQRLHAPSPSKSVTQRQRPTAEPEWEEF